MEATVRWRRSIDDLEFVNRSARTVDLCSCVCVHVSGTMATTPEKAHAFAAVGSVTTYAEPTQYAFSDRSVVVVVRAVAITMAAMAMTMTLSTVTPATVIIWLTAVMSTTPGRTVRYYVRLAPAVTETLIVWA